MNKFIGIFACLLIVALDVTAGILGIKGEAAQNQEKHLRLWIFECKEPSHEAFVLGVAAATLLCLAHVLVNLLGGCGLHYSGGASESSPQQEVVNGMPCFHLDHPGRWSIYAGDGNNIKQQIKGILRLLAPPFPFYWWDFVHGPRRVWRCLLCYLRRRPP
ncbi:UNVERIFIED_CONTAM: hypothetical protein Scaly_2238700 [Sesamum calycinum]|uniref:Uncharacterized protein n=1 Tax=Sesamum calycinum TaxID=2727403 RepID=A0AAW2MD42_9LAMI